VWLASVLLSGVLGLALCAAAARQGRGDDRWLCALVVAQALGVALAGGDWMPGFRLLAPITPLYIVLAATGAQRLFRTRMGAWGAAVALLFACGVPLTDLATRLPALRASGASREHVGRAMADMLRARATRVALVDIGYLGYASGIEVVDLGGITDPEVAHMVGGHLDKHVTSAWLARRAPDALVLHAKQAPRIDDDGGLRGLRAYPVEQRVAGSPWVRTNFSVARIFRYAPGYDYVLLLPRAEARRQSM